ncbi:hypothetical protein MMC12_008595 [Toensbergia leucococca]|nr:hypothetical protein [Toensbergia leucococca]
MVYYFTSTVTDPPATIYVGKDKFENEDLIKHGWEEDVWVRIGPTSCTTREKKGGRGSSARKVETNNGDAYSSTPTTSPAPTSTSASQIRKPGIACPKKL